MAAMEPVAADAADAESCAAVPSASLSLPQDSGWTLQWQAPSIFCTTRQHTSTCSRVCYMVMVADAADAESCVAVSSASLSLPQDSG